MTAFLLVTVYEFQDANILRYIDCSFSFSKIILDIF